MPVCPIIYKQIGYRAVPSIKEAVPSAEITVAVGKCVYWNSKHISESEKLYKAIFNDYSSYLNEKANKIVAELPNEIIARQIADEIGCKIQSYRGEKWYSFLPKDSGKLSAIKSLIKLSSTSSDSIVAFGDDDNDIEMLKLCGKGIAVANAVPEVLKISDAVTLSNDEDGVAKWLSDNCL